VAFDALPPHSVALDGYVPGPHIDAAARRFSFDHHAGCIRHATLSTCEMTLDAIRVGLEPGDLTVYINDLDPDTALAVWLLLRPHAAGQDAVASAVRALGRVDALGPAVGGPGLVPALRWALAPMLTPASAGTLRHLPLVEWRAIVDACVERLDGWCEAGAPERSPDMPAPPEPPRESPRILHRADGWVLAEGPGVLAFGALYASGARAAILCRPLADGTSEYTVGKASEFVAHFDVPAILDALREAERERNPAQADAHSWGGGSTIGGSPRNPDGSASRLSWEEVAAVVARALSGPAS